MQNPQKQSNCKYQETPINWCIMYTNICGLKHKRPSLIEVLESEKPDLFLLTETLFSNDTNIEIESYTFISKARLNQNGGGIGMLIANYRKTVLTPHTSNQPIEILWVSLRRKNDKPVFIGCYYGKQESRCMKAEIENEMDLLSEEIEENRNEVEVLIYMHGNGKIGILNEKKKQKWKATRRSFSKTINSQY